MKQVIEPDVYGGEVTVPLKSGVTGKHAVYFVFSIPEGKAEMDRFTFDD